MITTRFTFFSFMLSLLVMNALAGPILFITAFTVLAVIWLVSGFRYMLLGLAIYDSLQVSAFIQLVLSLPIVSQLTRLIAQGITSLSHTAPPANAFWAADLLASSPAIAIIGLFVFVQIYEVFVVQWGIKKILKKRMSVLRR